MTRRTKEPDRFWDRIAGHFDNRTRADEDYTRAAERVAKHLDADDTVLDYACGTGVITFKIAATVKHVHAIDTSAGMIDLARKRAIEQAVTNVSFAQDTLFNERLEAGSFDVILAFNILHLLENARKAVQRAFELMKPGGLLVSSTPCLGEAGVVLRSMVPLISKVIGLSYMRTFRIPEVKDLMLDAKLRILESEVRGGRIPLCFLVSRKPQDPGLQDVSG